MGRIKVMSDALSNRIAAGEVIERPASVVKELVENSIDAGASRIVIEIERAGTRLISVSDDGSGMDAEDVLLALEPHGTSKLTDEEQLGHITTMGFRGEALPSIASISRFEMFSRPTGSTEGTVVRVEGGRLTESAPAGGKTGTVVRVRDLFFNTPARKKFLKSPATEEHHIEEMVTALALGNCGVGFSLRVDGRPFLNVPPESRDDRLRELCGREYMRRMVKVEHREDDMTVSGFVAEPGFTRMGRREQRCYINSRAVEAQAVYRGIRDGYGTIGFEAGRFPPAVLFVEMPPELLDVNVHPAKREVRFKSDFAVTRLISTAVRMALRRSLNSEEKLPESLETVAKPLTSTPKLPVDYVLDEAALNYSPRTGEAQDLPLPELPPLPPLEEELPPPAPSPAVLKPFRPSEFTPLPSAPVRLTDSGNDESPSAPCGSSAPASTLADGAAAAVPDDGWPDQVLGIYDRSFILCSGKAGLVIVDQHAAHERIMFEAIVADYERDNSSAQTLLLPAVLELSHVQLGLLLRHRKIFERLGFEFEPAGGTTVLLSAVPVRLGSKRPPEELVPDMLEQLLDDSGGKLPVEGEYAARAACHAAVRAHDELTLEEAQKLLRQLRNCRQGRLCPHGRPTMITVTVRELEKRFLRR